MKALSVEEFIHAENLEDGCLSCGGELEESDYYNYNEKGQPLPRLICKVCHQVYEQIDDYPSAELQEEAR